MMVGYRVSNQSRLLLVQGQDQKPWHLLDSLACADFDVHTVQGEEGLSGFLSLDIAEDIGVILMDHSLSIIDLEPLIQRVRTSEVLADVPLCVVCDTKDHERLSLVEGARVKRVFDAAMTLASLRAHINLALEEFRSLVLLKRELARRTSAIGQIVSGQFRFKTREEGQNLATMLSMACPEPVPVAVGLTELFLNAVEHGNLEIGNSEKSRLIEQGCLAQEVCKRLEDKRFSVRNVEVEFQRHDGHVQFCIRDEGPGFDHTSFGLSPDEVSLEKNGRGILMARNCFTDICYEGRGNIVTARRDF